MNLNEGEWQAMLQMRSLLSNLSGNEDVSRGTRPLSDTVPSVGDKFDLEAVYRLYPRKIGKTLGMRKLRLQIRSESDYDELLVAVENYAKSVQGRSMEYIKQFSTFVNCWRDYIQPVQQNTSVPEPQQTYRISTND